MPLDIDDLEPGPDLEAIDLSGDRGNTLEPVKTVDEAKAAAEKQADEDLAALKTDEKVDEKSDEKVDEKSDERARDDKGRFKEAAIPKSRFDEAVGKERAAREAAETRLANLERQIADNTQRVDQSAQVAELETKADDLTAQHAKLIVDGEDEKAAAVMREIRKIDRQIVRIEQTTENQQQTAATLESERVNLVVAQLEAAHPQLNPDSEQFDESISAFVLSEMNRLMRSDGLSKSKAMARAATEIMDRYVVKADEKAEDKPEKQGLKASQDRKSAAVEKNLDASKRQPANMKESGVDSDKLGATSSTPDINQMTREEFDALPASTKARMRGDFM